MTALDEIFPGAATTRRRSSYATSHLTEEIEVTYPGEERLSLLLKHLGRASLLPEARDARPDFLNDPGRELHVYRHLLPVLDLGTARLYAAQPPARDGGGWLLLEKIDGVELWQIGDTATWELVARWLATFHQRAATLVAACASPPLLDYERDFLACWPQRATVFQATRPARERAALAKLVRGWPSRAERLLSIPRTVLHGDFHPSNVLVTGRRVCPVDWELAALGPGVIDLAALVSGFDAVQRRRLLRAYDEASRPGRWWATEDELAAAVDDARLYLCLKWLGWAPVWEPPAEHARDWLTEAVSLDQSQPG